MAPDAAREAKPQAAQYRLRVTNKFGIPVSTVPGQVPCNLSIPAATPRDTQADLAAIQQCLRDQDPETLFRHLRDRLPDMDYDALRWLVDRWARETAEKAPALGIDALTMAIDRRYPTGDKKRSSVLCILRGGLEQIFQRQPLGGEERAGTHVRITWQSRERLRAPRSGETSS